MEWYRWRIWRLAWGPIGRRGLEIHDLRGIWRRWRWRLWWLTQPRRNVKGWG